LFSRRKDKLAGFYADEDAVLPREVQGILGAIDRTEIKMLRALDRAMTVGRHEQT
jgi:hypothetical protein